MSHVLPTLIAAAAALLLTPLARAMAKRWEFVDRPDDGRKAHEQPIALGGGIVVLLAAMLGVVIALGFFFRGTHVAEESWNWWGLLAASALLCLVGIFDDRRAMPGKYKLLWQVVASSLVIGSGLIIERISFFGVTFELGLMGFPLTLFWLLAAINALNLIDGVDGLAPSVALVFSVTLGLMALLHGHAMAAVISLSIAGALCGFLPFNLPPAKIYLGDAGSLVLGLVLGTLALKCTFKEAATVAFAAPLALWAIPIFDSVVAIARRTLTGRSIYMTDRGHIHHRLLTRGLQPWQALAIVVGLCVVTSTAALASIYFRNEAIGIGIAGAVIVALVATRVFGHVELLLLNNALVGIGRSWVPATNRTAARHTSIQLQGTVAWEQLWEALVESAPRFGLCEITLNLNAPRLHEDFYATWKRREGIATSESWQINVPLDIQGAISGRLRVVGQPLGENLTEHLQGFLDYVELVQADVCQLADPTTPKIDDPDRQPGKSDEVVVESVR